MAYADGVEELAQWTLLAPFVGLGVSVVAAVVLLTGPRRKISLVMLVLSALSLGLFLYNPFIAADVKWRHAENSGFSLLLLVLFLQLVGMIYWPVKSVWVNRPVLIGLAVCFLAAVVMAVLGAW